MLVPLTDRRNWNQTGRTGDEQRELVVSTLVEVDVQLCCVCVTFVCADRL